MASAVALALSPAAAQAEQVCPDAATVQAARVVEFQTMMMGVAVRCRHVGVPVMDHLDGMNSARRTMFVGANDRVATYLRSLNAKPAATATALTAPTPAPPAKTAPAKAAAGKARKSPAKPPAAKVSRRTDPYDRYLTMIGNQYGAGVTTLQRCKAFDAIVLSLSDKTNTDRLLTMVSSSLVQATLLEAIIKCPAGK
jgi:hypothetical protein